MDKFLELLDMIEHEVLLHQTRRSSYVQTYKDVEGVVGVDDIQDVFDKYRTIISGETIPVENSNTVYGNNSEEIEQLFRDMCDELSE